MAAPIAYAVNNNTAFLVRLDVDGGEKNCCRFVGGERTGASSWSISKRVR